MPSAPPAEDPAPEPEPSPDGARPPGTGDDDCLQERDKSKTYQTYTKFNMDTGEYYVGRTSGKGTPRENVDQRNSGHEYNKQGFGRSVLDESSDCYGAIRGREQNLIDLYRRLGRSANKINGISPLNKNLADYLTDSLTHFGGS